MYRALEPFEELGDRRRCRRPVTLFSLLPVQGSLHPSGPITAELLVHLRDSTVRKLSRWGSRVGQRAVKTHMIDKRWCLRGHHARLDETVRSLNSARKSSLDSALTAGVVEDREARKPGRWGRGYCQLNARWAKLQYHGDLSCPYSPFASSMVSHIVWSSPSSPNSS